MHPCSIESVREGFVCGLYELSEDQYRDGAVIRYSNKGEELQRVEFDSGVLDLKLSGNRGILGCALSSSKMAFCGIRADGILEREGEVFLGDEGLILSLSWNDVSIPEAFPKIATSSQNSSIHVLSMREGGIDVVSKISGGHVLRGEVVPIWTVSYNTHTKDVLASGGDDNALKLWDIRQSDNPIAVAGQMKSHTAGVTSVRAKLNIIVNFFIDRKNAIFSIDSMASVQ